MASKAILRRALLYGRYCCLWPQLGAGGLTGSIVPGSNKRMLEKSRGLDVDCIVQSSYPRELAIAHDVEVGL